MTARARATAAKARGETFHNDTGFEVVRRSPAPGAGLQTVLVAHCRDCRQPGEVAITHAGVNVDGTFALRKFRDAGWQMGSSRRKDRCPACVKARHFHAAPDPHLMSTAIGAALAEAVIAKTEPAADTPGERPQNANLRRAVAARTPEKQRSAIGRLGAAAKAEKRRATQASAAPQTLIPLQEARPMTVAERYPSAEIRKPTPADNRRILDALEAEYDAKAGRYLATGSDRAMGEALNLPAAWIADVRTQFFGEDRNEAAAVLTADLLGFAAKISDFEARFMEALEAFAAEQKALKAAIAEAARRAGLPRQAA